MNIENLGVSIGVLFSNYLHYLSFQAGASVGGGDFVFSSELKMGYLGSKSPRLINISTLM